MSGFYYFFPRSCGIQAIDEAGLSYAFPRPPTMTEVGPAAGAAGLAGTVFHAGETPTLPALTWRDSEKGWWVGWSPAARPTERHLRKDVTPSTSGWVRLADGAEWEIPLIVPCNALDPRRTSGLPLVFTAAAGVELDQRKAWPDFMSQQRVLRVAAPYQALYAWAERLREIGMTRPKEWPHDQTVSFCAALLGVVYRVTEEEVIALELLTPAAAKIMLHIAFDVVESARAEMSGENRAAFDGFVTASGAKAGS